MFRLLHKSLLLFASVVLIDAVGSLAAREVPSRIEQIAQTVHELRNMLDSEGRFREDDDSHFLESVDREGDKLSGVKQYLFAGFEHGMRKLISDPCETLRRPMILTATIWRGSNEHDIDLRVIWLSETNTVARVYIQGVRGTTIATGPITSTEGDSDQSSFLQNGRARICGSEDEKSIPLLTISPKELAQDLWIGFIEKDGRRTKPIRVFIDENIEMQQGKRCK
jgi:hypothetical protein